MIRNYLLVALASVALVISRHCTGRRWRRRRWCCRRRRRELLPATGAGAGTSSAASGGPSAPSGMGTNATSTGRSHQQLSDQSERPSSDPEWEYCKPNLLNRPLVPQRPALTKTGSQNVDRSGITAPEQSPNSNSNSNSNRQMSPAEQARTGSRRSRKSRLRCR